MAGIVALVSAISAQVVASLAAAGYPPLVDGKIVLGREHEYEETAPPRIIFVHTGSTFGPRSVYSASQVALNAPYSTEAIAQLRQRAILTEIVRFEVRCWAQSATADPETDTDALQALYSAVLLAMHLLAPGSFGVESLTCTDAQISNAQVSRMGREAVFGLTVQTPVLDQLLPLAPANTHTALTNKLTSADGTVTETGCSG